MKIDVKNISFFEQENKFKLSKKLKKGLATGILLAGVSLVLAGCSTKKEEPLYSSNNVKLSDFVKEESVEPTKISLDEINQLNVIINDNDCGDTWINDVCTKLDEDGLSYQFSRQGEGIDVDNAVVITLDQQYISGPGMVVLAPYENERTGNSDALALAANAAFAQEGFFTDGIFCGKSGYRETDFGTVVTRVPTSTEENIGQDKNTCFVTLCFGTDDMSTQLVAESIKNTLGRYASYTKENQNVDLVHRIEAADTLSGLAEIYHTSESMINKVNGMDYDNNSIQIDQAMINPIMQDYQEFDKTAVIEISNEKSSAKTH